MFSTPLICSSIGATTVEATTSALAPGYWPDHVDDRRRDLRILRDRQAREGDRAEDHEHDRDHGAKIGRSMKKCEIRMSVAPTVALACGPAGPAGAAPCSCGVTFWPGRTRIRPLTMTRSSGRDPVLDDAQIVVAQRSERDVFLHRGVVVADHQHEFADLLGADRGIRQQQAPCRSASPARGCARTCRA